jgi:hypothetical protein
MHMLKYSELCTRFCVCLKSIKSLVKEAIFWSVFETMRQWVCGEGRLKHTQCFWGIILCISQWCQCYEFDSFVNKQTYLYDSEIRPFPLLYTCLVIWVFLKAFLLSFILLEYFEKQNGNGTLWFKQILWKWLLERKLSAIIYCEYIKVLFQRSRTQVLPFGASL